jgi:protein-disulfide isomerase
MTTVLTLTACTASFSIGQQPAQTDDCAGKDGKCSVAEHEARQPVVAGDLDARIHDYLLAHPEVIAETQRTASQKQVEARLAQARQAIAANRDAIFNDPEDPVIGSASGDVTIVEAFDSECPFCKKIAPEIDALIKADPGVRVVLKEYPILGPMSETAAKYALAAQRQGQNKYAAFHATLMASTIQEHQLTEANIIDFAAESGLDIARLKKDVTDPSILNRIAANRALAQKIGITGTPGVIIGDTLQPGFMTLDAMKQAVTAARAKKVASVQ